MLPSSHCSPGSRWASPQIGTGTGMHAPPAGGHVQPAFTCEQSAAQPAAPVVVPSSHASLPSTTPSPHTIVDVQTWCTGVGGGVGVAQSKLGSVWQVPEQPSPGIELPSSQVSGASTMPSPHQTCRTHGAPTVGHCQPSSIAHDDEQPSPDVALPSSHCSPASRMPSLHRGASAVG